MKKFSNNQLERYPVYLKYLKELEKEGKETISSPVIGKVLGYSEEQIRKDLQAVSNEAGRPKKGRSIAQLIDALETFLGYKDVMNAVIIGAGHLGGALLNYPYFGQMGLSVVAGFDIDKSKVGLQIGGKDIYPLEDLPKKWNELKASIAIITVNETAAQMAVDAAVKSGARAIWNFAPTHLIVPDGVVIETVNLASSLAVLSNRLNSQHEKEE